MSTSPTAQPPSPAPRRKAAVVAISSQVGRGSVGLRASFALERLGHPVWQVPTVYLAWHPGHGPSTRIVTPTAGLAAVLEDFAHSPHVGEVGAVVTGYLGSADQAEPVARFVAAVKRANPDALHVCDPIIGDAGGLYVGAETAAAIRDQLIPLADAATPNAFELGWLTGMPVSDPSETRAAALALGPRRVLVTSAPPMMRDSVALLYVTPEAVMAAEHPFVAGAANGPGDLATALFTAGLLAGDDPEVLLKRVAAAVFEMVARTARAGADELILTTEQDTLVRPMALVSVRRIATEARPARPRPR